MPIARDSKLESREGRSKLKTAHAPYWRKIHIGLAIGYRKGTSGGVWIARNLKDGEYKFKTLGNADDRQDADGSNVLNYAQATKAAFEFADEKVISSTYTVKEGGEHYLQFLASHKKSAAKTGYVLSKYVYPHVKDGKTFGDTPIAKLTQADYQGWIDARAESLSEHHKGPTTPETQRQRKSTANRQWTAFRALLNYAKANNRVPSDEEWKGVQVFHFKKGEGARKVFLQPDQVQRLINVTQGEFRKYVRALWYTGCRPGKEIEAPTVKDFDAENKSLHIPDSKTGPRDVYLTDEGAEFFSQITTGKHPDDPILTDDHGKKWPGTTLNNRMEAAVKLAKLPADTVLYSLRHTYISLNLKGGMNIKALADNAGTSIDMIESNYGKFLADDKRQMLNKAMPSLEPEKSNVVAIR